MTDGPMLDSWMCGQHDIRPQSKNAPKKTPVRPFLHLFFFLRECRADLTMTKLRECKLPNISHMREEKRI